MTDAQELFFTQAASRVVFAALLILFLTGTDRDTGLFHQWAEILVPTVIGAVGYSALRACVMSTPSAPRAGAKRLDWIIVLGRILIDNSIFLWIWGAVFCFSVIRRGYPELSLDDTLRVFMFPWVSASFVQFGVTILRNHTRKA